MKVDEKECPVIDKVQQAAEGLVGALREMDDGQRAYLESLSEMEDEEFEGERFEFAPIWLGRTSEMEHPVTLVELARGMEGLAKMVRTKHPA